MFVGVGSAIERQWLILSLLPKRPRRVDTASLEQRLRERGYNVHRRTIQRDLVQLSAVLPIIADERQKPFGWRWSENACLPCSNDRSATSSVKIRARVRNAMLQTVLDELHARDVETEPGSTTLVECTVDDTAATRRRLLGFAIDLEVLAPDTLRRELADRAGQAARLYGK
jgi:predicted DNA-binding transcriptional regulator YafY